MSISYISIKNIPIPFLLNKATQQRDQDENCSNERLNNIIQDSNQSNKSLTFQIEKSS